MNYREHIEARIGKPITSTSVPSSNQLKSYLITGTIEVISNIAKFNPGASALFETISENQTENGFKVPSGVIMQVLRSDGDANLSASYGNILRPCKLVSNELQELVKNPSSIYFANDNYPVWIRGEDNTVNVFPEIDSNKNEYYQVHYMNYPEYDNMNKVLSSETDIDNVGIKNFPKAYHPHLLLYGAIQSLKQYYLYLLNEEEDMELAQIYLKSYTVMQEELTQMFITRDMLKSSAEQEEGRK